MTFLHVALLSGVALVAVPIVLHLIMRQQPRLVEFPALRFIRQREQSNRRKLKLRHLLLLALRCAVISLLAMALARPSIQASGVMLGREAPAAVGMVFDTSPRMDYRNQNKTRLELARETGTWLLTELPAESDVAVVDGRTTSATFAIDVGAARQRISRLIATPAGQALPLLVEDCARLLMESPKQRKELYIFTDLTASNWSGDAARRLVANLSAASNVAIYVIDVGVNEPSNSGLSRLEFSSQSLTVGAPLRLSTELVNVGPAGTRTVELYLADGNGQFQKRSQETLSYRAGESQTTEFRLGVLEAGVHQGYLKIAEEDALPWDDRRYFTVSVTPARRVLIAAPEPADKNAFFLSEALAPRPLRLKREAAFECRTVSLPQLGRQSLAKAAAVCLVDPGPLEDATWQKLAQFAEAGGGVGIFLGRHGRLDALNKPAAQALLPARLLRHWNATGDGVYLAPRSMQHPIFAALRARESDIPWDAMSVFTHWQLAAPPKGVNIVAPYTNGQPALLEKPLGKGRVLTLTTSLSDPPGARDAWNVLLTGEESWPFFVLINEMALYLSGNNEGRKNYLAGETVVLRLGPNARQPVFALLNPRGDRIRQSADLKQNTLVITGTDAPGNYRAVATGEAGPITLGFSVNLPEDVSRLERVSAEQLKTLFGKTPYRLARNREEIDRSVSASRVGRELYPYLMILLAIVLAGEQILSNRFYRHEQETPTGATREELLATRSPEAATDRPVAEVTAP